MAEFWRALRTLKALQAEQALQTQQAIETGAAVAAHLQKPRRRRHSPRACSQTNRRALARPQYLPSAPPASGALHRPPPPGGRTNPSNSNPCHVHLNQLPNSTEPATVLSARPTSDPRTSRRS